MKKTKLNNKNKVKKNKKTLNVDKYVSEESKEVRKFIIILLSIIIIVLAVYAVTKLVGKDEESAKSNITAGEIDYDKVSVGTMFNRLDSEYYVIVYDGDDANAIYYSALINKYMDSEDSLKVYFCDLSNELNKKYYVQNESVSNPKATKPSELAFKDLTLIKIKDGKNVKYLETLDTIKVELGI